MWVGVVDGAFTAECDIVGDATFGSCLDAPDEYLAVLGPRRVTAMRRGEH